jgi:aerobic carbon-monoxide dehydrogenase large subunit
MTAPGTSFGRRIERLEDRRLVTGRGRYTDDVEHDAAEVAFVRSEHAHARIADVDVSGALDVDGVLAVFTHEDLEGNLAEPLPLLIPHPGLVAPRTQHALAVGEVRHVGEPIAMVVARDRYLAEDAAARVRVTYEPLPAVIDLEQAAADLANVAGRFAESTGDVAAALEAAPHVFEWRFDVERSAGMPMEGRAVSARHDANEDRLVVHDTTQSPHAIRGGLAMLLGIDAEQVEVIAPDVGGGFGTKGMQFYPEEVLIPWAARSLGIPVKWTEDRREHFIASNHERGQIHEVRVGCDDDGRILALETRFLHDSGAYCPFGLIVPVITAAQLPGPYRLGAYAYELQAIYTNTVTVSPYRGAGRPQGIFVVERVLERIARALGLDRADVRRVNLIQPDEFPYDVGVTFQDGNRTVYDSGDYPAGFDLLMDEVGYATFEERRATARAEGRRIGIGFGCYVEGTGIGPYEGATVAVMPDGAVTVASGVGSQGQGHETVFAQIAADELGVEPADVRVTTGDSTRIAYGAGTFASRVAVVAGNAVQAAAIEVRRQAAEVAARLLEAAPGDIDFAGGQAHVRGTRDPALRIPLGQLAVIANPLRYAFGEQAQIAAQLAQRASSKSDRPLAEGDAPGLGATEYFSPSAAVYGFGMHAAIVEVDSATHDVRILRYVVVHDCGRPVNPLVVDGQVTGAVAQGVGGALYERLAYDADGQLVNASFMDFLIPYATESVRPELHHSEVPSPSNPLGVKGVGEAGIIPVSAAITNAVADAIGQPIDHTPLTPLDLFELERSARAGAA